MTSIRRPLLFVLIAALLGATVYFVLYGFGANAPAQPGAAQGPTVAGTPDELRGTGTPGATAKDASADRTDLPAPEAPRGPTYRLRGVALPELAAPFDGARVLAFAAKAHDTRMSMTNMFSQIEGSMNDPRALAALRGNFGDAIAETPVGTDGRFAFAALPTRHVVLLLDHHYYALAQPEIIHIDPERDAYVTLRPRLGGQILGRVADPPKSATTIRLTAEIDIMTMMRRPEDFMGHIVNSTSNEATVGTDGRFEFRAITPSSNVHLLLRGDERAARFGPTSIQAGQTREVVVHSIACGTLQVTIQGPGATPVDAAGLRLMPDGVVGQQSAAFSSRHGHTDAAGKATIAGLLPGVYDVAIDASGFVGATRRVEIHGGKTASLDVTLDAGGQVSGLVVDEDGRPISDAGVGYLQAIKVPLIGDIAAFTGEDLMARAARSSRVRTDAEGRFVLGGIADAGTFSVIAWHNDFGGGMAQDVQLGDESVTITMRHPARVLGRVVDDATGEPIPDFSVSTVVRWVMVMERATSHRRFEKSETGAFTLEGVRSGKSKLQIQALGYADFATAIELAPAKDLDVGELRLKRAAAVRGIVVDADGRPVAGATVARKAQGMLDNPILRSMSGDASVSTDETGHFELTGLRDGAIKLKATAPGHASGVSKRLRLRSGETIDGVELRLGKGGAVHGEFLPPEGRGVAGWLVTLSNNQGGSMQSVYVDIDGTFKFENVDPGKYDIQGMNERLMADLSSTKMQTFRGGQPTNLGELITKAQEQIVRTKCRVKTGEITEVTLDASEQGSGGVAVTFRVKLGDKPLDSGWMEIERVETGEFTQAFIENGVARNSALAAGTVRVQVRTGITMTPVGDPVTLVIPETDSHSATVALPGGRIRGAVVDQETGEPLLDAVVRIVSAGGSVSDQVEEIGFATTDDKGEFEFDGLRDGTYSLFANESFFHRDTTLQSGRLEGISIVSSREPRKVTLRTRRAARATLTVDDERGRPQEHALVYAVDPDGKPLSLLPARTDDRGQATVMGLPTGKLRLVVIARGLVPGFSDVQELLPARETRFRLTLGTGPRVRVRIENPDGNTLEGARLSARWNDGPWIPLSLVQRFDPRTRQVDLGHLAAGRVEFRVHHRTATPFSVVREIPRSAAVELVFTAPR